MGMPQRQPVRPAAPVSPAPDRFAGCNRPRPRPCARERAVTWVRFWVVAFLLAAGWMALQAAIIVTGTELVQARGELAGTVRAGDELRLELASLRSVARIEALAAQRLGFVRPPVNRAAATADATSREVVWEGRSVTLALTGSEEDAGAGTGTRPRPPMGAWDAFLNWLTGRPAEAVTRD